MLSLRNVIEDLTQWKARKAVILSGADKKFCAGIDPRFSVENLNAAFAQDI